MYKILGCLAVILLLSGSSVQACNATIPSGNFCLHGDTYGPGAGGGNAVVCYSFDPNCDAPAATVYEFNGGAFEFLPGYNGDTWYWGVQYPSGAGAVWYYWDTPNIIAANPTSAGVTISNTWGSSCTDEGYYDGFPGCS